MILKDFLILDFTHRLPGPLAGNILASLGAKVIKIEDKTFGDSFSKGDYAQIDKSFLHWYKSLNDKKEIQSFDFKSQEDQKKIRELVSKANGVIQGVGLQLRENLGLTQKQLEESSVYKAVVELGSSPTYKKAMHDLNSLAISGMLELYTANKDEKILPPPFLPFSGILFGNKIATDLLGCLLKAQKEKLSIFHTCYLLETTQEILEPFWPKQLKDNKEYTFLHNGLYPCYCLYQLKDGKYVALAAVEEKFWASFCETFNLSIEPQKRFFHKDNSIFKMISELFQKYDQKDIQKLIEDKDFCLSLI